MALKVVVSSIKQLANQYPQHTYFFITATSFVSELAVLPHVQTVTLPQQTNNPLLWKIWYHYKLPALLKELKADVLIQCDGITSLRTKLPQCLLVNDLNFVTNPDWYSKKFVRFMQSNSPAFFKKATTIIAGSEYLKILLNEKYQLNKEKITVIYPGTDTSFKPIEWQEREIIKDKYSSGKEYFLFYGELHPRSNLITLLKAFSFFKKRQKSNMQLLIACNELLEDTTIEQSLKTYKYRNEVQLLKTNEAADLQAITAGAYAFVSSAYVENNSSMLLNVLNCNVPVIVSQTEKNMEILGEAALYVNSESFEDVADKMMLLFKDEDKRNKIIQKGIQQVSLYRGGKAVNLLWKTIEATIE